jgi:hypothetical protein
MPGATVPDAIPYPVTGDDLVPLETWLAAIANGAQTALVNFRAGKNFSFRGTTAGKGAVTGMLAGDKYLETDGDKRTWRYDGASWKLWTDIWRNLTNGAGVTNLDGAPSGYRLFEGQVTVRISASVSMAQGSVTNVATGLPLDMQPPTGSPIVRAGIGAGTGGFVVLANVYPAGHSDAGKVAVSNYTGATRQWAGGYVTPYSIY